MTVDFKPYEGPEPYVFVSYSHKDSETVFLLLNAMHAAGYRVWYDEGIPWGGEWMDILAAKILGAACCLAFHSRNSSESLNCKAEIREILAQKKQIVSVYLEEAALAPGVNMYLRLFQSVKYSQYETTDRFIAALDRQSVFAPCKTSAPASVETNPASPPLPWRTDGGIRWAFRAGTLTIDRAPSSDGRMPGYRWNAERNRAMTPWRAIRANIRALEIRAGVVTIGQDAFRGCSKLTSVQMAEGVTEIGVSAFADCVRLRTVDLPDGVAGIGAYAFFGCAALSGVYLPDSVATIGFSAFCGCPNLTEVVVPAQTYKTDAFEDHTKITRRRRP